MPHTPTQNHLLAALPAADFNRIGPHLELVWMPLGETLFESCRYAEYVYFPVNAVVSLLSSLKDDSLSEIAVVGNEGVLGISQLLVDVPPGRAIVLSAGYGYRLSGQVLQAEYNRAGPMLRLMLRYAKALTTQITQTVACHRQHTVEQQLCRLLLLSLDRVPSNELTITQDLIANMLGLQNSRIKQAAANLQRAGFINYRRGHINVVDRDGMKNVVCECYALVKTEVDRLVSDIGRADHCHTAAQPSG